MDEITKDKRFAHIVKDSRFRTLPKSERKAYIDKRFKDVFSDKKFKLKYEVDKRGRPINMSHKDNLKKFYELEDDQVEDEEDEEKKEKSEEVEKSDESEDAESQPDEDDEEGEENEIDSGVSEESDESSSSSDDSDEDDDYESPDEKELATEEVIPWNEFDKDTKRSDDISCRLAVCNMDWDRIKAVDLFVALSSFKPADGVIKSVKIYLSEFGAKRLEYERLHGPVELVDGTPGDGLGDDESDSDDEKDSDDDADDEEGTKFDHRKLRKYQFNRLRYYYAIVECDSKQTANHIYTECDGMEYESSSIRFDLRFVPDDMEFTEKPTQVCTESPNPGTFKPNLFVTTALNQTKVECTWDETPRDRLAVTMRKYTEDELKGCNDFDNLLAMSSEEEDNEEEDDVEDRKTKEAAKDDKKDEGNGKKNGNKYDEFRQTLLGLIGKKKQKKRDGDLFFSWDNPMDKHTSFDSFDTQAASRNRDKPSKKEFGKPKEKELTEEQKRGKAELDLIMMGDENQKSHFSLDDLLIKNAGAKGKKRKLVNEKDTDGFKLDTKDKRFEAIYTSHEFNIDPSDKLYKPTKGMEDLMSEKIAKKSAKPNDEQISAKLPKIDETTSLIKSIKNKTQLLDKNSKTKNK